MLMPQVPYTQILKHIPYIVYFHQKQQKYN